jgi:hypothetical protein
MCVREAVESDESNSKSMEDEEVEDSPNEWTPTTPPKSHLYTYLQNETRMRDNSARRTQYFVAPINYL